MNWHFHIKFQATEMKVRKKRLSWQEIIPMSSGVIFSIKIRRRSVDVYCDEYSQGFLTYLIEACLPEQTADMEVLRICQTEMKINAWFIFSGEDLLHVGRTVINIIRGYSSIRRINLTKPRIPLGICVIFVFLCCLLISWIVSLFLVLCLSQWFRRYFLTSVSL